MKKEKEAKHLEAVAYLRTVLKPGDRVYTVLNRVSSNGMTRHIEVVIPSHDSENTPTIHNITWWVGNALGYRRSDKTGGLVVGGCGMDMGFHLVYSLGRVLFRDEGYQCVGRNCVHNSHFNEGTDRDGSIFHDGDMGYSLSHSWV